MNGIETGGRVKRDSFWLSLLRFCLVLRNPKIRCYLAAFSAFFSAMALGVGQAEAQVFSTLHYFDGGDGALPFAGLVLSSNTLYGSTPLGGIFGYGTIFAIRTDGTGFTNLYNFSGGNDGAEPFAGLILSGNRLYGTTAGENGNDNDSGTVFAINSDGTCFTNLYNFTATSTNTEGILTNSDGTGPLAPLLLSGNTLYGTASAAGTNGYGTVFAIKTDGTGFTNLYDFNGGNGVDPVASLTCSSNVLYGTTYYGGTNGYGTIFAINTNGTGFTNLHDFTALNNGTNADGANPQAGLILSGNKLYGTTYNGGTNGYGAVFAINTDGTSFTNLHSFTARSPFNTDGANPEAGLILSGNMLYGTAYYGGTNGYGTIFAINTDGTGFTNLYSFADGANPFAALILSENTLYGTTENGGGEEESGTVFALSLGLIPLSIQSSGQTPIITWGNPAFALQTASAPAGPWTTLANAASPYTVNTTNTQTFFQLVSTNDP